MSNLPTYSIGLDNPAVVRIVAAMASMIKNSFFIIGIPMMLILDILYGANYYGFYSTGPFGTFLAYAISFSTTCTQMITWSIALNAGGMRKLYRRDLEGKLCVIGSNLLLIVDTLADWGGVTAATLGKSDAINLIPSQITAWWLITSIVVIILAALNEPILGAQLNTARAALNASKVVTSPSAVNDSTLDDEINRLEGASHIELAGEFG